ncbi:MAG: Abi family protein, partial [Nitrososphaeraceae archaeon]
LKSKKSYLKTFKTIDEQIQLLKSRGMLFNDYTTAYQSMLNLNYYRLSGYWLPYKNADDGSLDISFEEIIGIYNFDKEFKLLLFGAIETIEISARTKFAYYLSSKYGTHPLIKSNFYNQQWFDKSYGKLEFELNRKDQHVFIDHFRDKYREDLPPIWACVETMTFGLLSQFVNNIKDNTIKHQIAKDYKLGTSDLESILYHLSTLRNDIAHHDRVYNKIFKIIPKIPNKLMNISNQTAIGYIYNTIIIMDYLLKQIEPNSDFVAEVGKLISKYNIDKSKMGYPK